MSFDHFKGEVPDREGRAVRSRSFTLYPPDGASRQVGYRHADEIAGEPPGNGGSGNDGCAVSVEREGRHEADTVDLGE